MSLPTIFTDGTYKININYLNTLCTFCLDIILIKKWNNNIRLIFWQNNKIDTKEFIVFS